MSKLMENARKIARGEIPETPVKELKEDASYKGKGKEKQDAPLPQGSSKKATVEPMYKGGAKGVKSAAPLAPKVREFQAEKPKQGSSQDAPIEDVDSAEVGKKVAAKMKKDTTLPKGAGAGKAPNFKTKGDPTKNVGAKSNDGNTFQEPGNHGPVRRVAEEAEDEEIIEMSQEEFDALSPEEQDELIPIEEVTEETDEELEEKVKADKSKKEKSDKEEEKAYEAKHKEHKEQVSFDVKTLFASETELSEEFKEKAAGLFEAAVSARVALEVDALTDALAEESIAVIEEHKAELTEQVDAYLTEVANEWLTANEIALDDSLRTDIAESFMESMRETFAKHYIDVPEDRYDVMAGLQEEIDALKEEVEARDEEANNLAEQLLALKKSAIVAVVTEGLAETEVERFEKLIEDVSFEDDETYTDKLKVVKENVFKKGEVTLSETVLDNEEAVEEEPTGRMAVYKRALRSGARNRG